tara:strand:+ start:171 stop:1199 length:1029 start_codon:yes stop_codon:yes gene_type:complete
MKNFIKIITYNIFFIFILIIFFEVFFGYFLKNNNFGYIMRSERQKNQIYEVIHNNIKYRYKYKRNFYGFRGDEIDPSEIKIVFEGGSTGNQKFTPEELIIVGLLNKKLKDFDKDIKIINASTDGKTTRGYVNDFIHWFSKLKNFNPEYVIFYTGINDSNLLQPRKFDIPWREDRLSKIRDYFKNNSKSYELIKKFQFNFFLENNIRKEYGITKINKNLYKNYEYINYKKASEIHKNYNDIKLINQFAERLETLKYYIAKLNVTPIFITQIEYNGLSNNKLYVINEYLKKFCKENGYSIIKLDELINNLEINSFYDYMHTTPRGSITIANKIYPELIKILNIN